MLPLDMWTLLTCCLCCGTLDAGSQILHTGLTKWGARHPARPYVISHEPYNIKINTNKIGWASHISKSLVHVMLTISEFVNSCVQDN